MDQENLRILLWMAFFALFINSPFAHREELVLGAEKRRVKPLYAVIAFAPIFFFCVYGSIRGDMYAYLNYYHGLPDTLGGIMTMIAGSDKPGFDLFSVAVKMLFGGSDRAYRFILCLVHSIPLITIFRRYSCRYLFTLYLLIASSIHIAYMSNGVRQFMACALIFATTPWMIEKKYFRTIIVILLAATIHRTAIIMIPVLFIVQGKTWNRRTILFILGAVAATFVFARNFSIFSDIASDLGYNVGEAIDSGDNGANPLRALVSAVPMVLAFVFRREIEEANDPMINICVNMSVITAGINIVAVVTSGITIGRLPIFTVLYNLILLPYIIEYIVPVKLRGIVRYSCLGLYLIFFMYELR